NATFQVEDLLEALLFKISRGFFAANPAGTKHCDFLVFGWVEVIGNIGRKFPKSLRLWVYSAFERTYRVFIVIPRIDYHNFWITDQGIPVLRFDIGTHNPLGIYAIHTHG